MSFQNLPGINYAVINSFEKIFIKHGYIKRDFYSFKEKKLNAFWYSHPEKNMPRIFISELKVDELSIATQKIIKHYTNQVKNDPVDDIDLNLDNTKYSHDVFSPGARLRRSILYHLAIFNLLFVLITIVNN